MSDVDAGLFVTAKIRVKPEVELISALASIEAFCQAMTQEPGCLLAYATQSIEDPRVILLWECYQDSCAIEAHFAMPHTQAFIQSGITELLDGYQSQDCFAGQLLQLKKRKSK